MTENENLKKQITDDLSAVLKEAKSMGCKEVTCFRHIPLQNVETVIQALEEIQQYRAIGTVEECQQRKEYFDIINEVLKNYSDIGTVEECRTAVERMKPKKPFQPFGTHSYKCSNCWQFVAHEVDDNCDLSSLAEWCPYCGSRIDWSE